MCLTDFNIDPLHISRSLCNVELVLIVWIGGEGEDLGRELDRAALLVARFRCFSCDFIEG